MTQIHDRRYSEYLRNEDRNDIWAYGIAFFKKRGKVVAEKIEVKLTTGVLPTVCI